MKRNNCKSHEATGGRGNEYALHLESLDDLGRGSKDGEVHRKTRELK